MQVAATSRARDKAASNGDAFVVFQTTGPRPMVVDSSLLGTRRSAFTLDRSNEYLLAVVDGLGHGIEAAKAARRVVETIERALAQPGDLLDIVDECHIAAIGTRGATLAMAQLGATELNFVGVGNILAQVGRVTSIGVPNARALISGAGVVGYQVPESLPINSTDLEKGEVLVMCSDGVSPSFSLEHLAPESFQSAKACRDAIVQRFAVVEDDMTVLVLM